MKLISILQIATVSVTLFVSGCAPTHRAGMVKDPETGLQYGSVVEKNIVVDASQFPDNSLKIRLRNVSGDPVFDLSELKDQIEEKYIGKGYAVTNGNDNALLLDVNVVYSGQASENMAAEFGLVGAAAGGVGGTQVGRDGALGVAGGIIAGATLGAILGSYVSDDTFVVVAEVTLGISKPGASSKKKTIVFSSSENTTKTEELSFDPFRQVISTTVSVYAGGRNVTQAEIADEVRLRFGRILSDIL